MSEKKEIYKTTLVKANESFLPQIENQFSGNGMQMDDYSKKCTLNAISAINNVLDEKGIKWNDPQLDQSNLTQTLLKVASLKLNPSANPREAYFQLRRVKRQVVDENGKKVDEWKKQIEMGIEGDGNDAILSNFGRGVKEVRQHWLVRENDEFEYPAYDGLEMSPPKWRPKGTGKVVRVVYPVIKTSGAVEYYIAEREDVIKNLLAHINNNLMNETFGLAESRFKATKKQKEEIDEKKQEILDRVNDLGLDDALANKDIQKHVSPAWKDPQSRESMLVRKMRNNIVKKIPKDFGHTLAEMSYDDSANDYKEQTRREVNENANQETIDIDMNSESTNQNADDTVSEIVDNKEDEQQKEPENKQQEAVGKADDPFDFLSTNRK